MRDNKLLIGQNTEHGCSVKVSQKKLEDILQEISKKKNLRVLAGIGEDVAAISINKELAVLSTVDFFTPVSYDPYTQGWITANNSVNDIYAKGATDILGFAMILGLPRNVKLETSKEIIRGFNDFTTQEGSCVTGGHTIYNPVYITGASVTALIKKKDFVKNSTAKAGDVLILTKPLGTDVAVKAFHELCKEPSVKRVYRKAVEVMKESSRPVAYVMRDVGVSAATDVTGFGLMGHAREIAERSRVDIKIRSLPLLAGTLKLSELFDIPLTSGLSPETAGGILISVPREKEEELVSRLRKKKIKCFSVGDVWAGRGKVVLDEGVELISV